ncbi:MAG TPA: hypothetical protein VH228_07855 [Nocardioides sp.]|jgi:hypothetical protein|nr:hypothetical protein [Nocardioides sp.]
MRTRARILGATAVAAAVVVTVPVLTSSSAHAARFTGGNVVVYRVGDGGAALTNAAAPVFLDEYSSAGTNVQSVPLPTTSTEGNTRLTASGQSRSEGLIDRSADGRFIAVTGYDAAPGATGASDANVPGGKLSLTTTSPTAVPRVVGLVDANGNVDTTTTLADAGSAKIIRSATTTNGERLWATGGNGGIVTATRGSATSSTVVGDAASNLSSLTVQGGQLFSSGILADRLAAVGTGTPTSGALSDLHGLPDNLLTYGYAFADLVPGVGLGSTGLDTVYIADGSSRAGTIDKYRLSGSTWTSAGSVDVPGALGIVADATGNSVSLAVTTPTQLVTLTDSNGSAASFAPSGPSLLATAPANTEFRGVALAPTTTAGPSAFIRTPGAGASITLGATTPVTVYAASAGDADHVSAVDVQLGTGASVAATQSGHLWTAQVPTTGLAAGAGKLTVHATDPTGTTTVTRSVTLTGKTVVPAGNLGAGTYPWTAKQVKVTGSWSTYKTSHSPSGKGRTSTKKKSTASAKVFGHGLVLTFDRSAKAGKVKVTVDGKAKTFDLFSKAGKPLSESWTFTGALKSHSVVVTVLGTKSSASKGTAVLLAALKVKA